MSRPLRVEYPGAFYHIAARGNAKQKIFLDTKDRKKFLEILSSVVERTDWICHSHVLMNNHYHLLIETPKPNLSQGMRQLNGVYTQYFNRRHRRVGHLFQGRFKALLVEKDSYLLELCRYILRNPVRAKLVRDPGAYRWSSYGAIVGKEKCPDFLRKEWVISQFGEDKKKAIEQFESYVSSGKDTPFPSDEIAGQLILGSKGFIEKIKKYLPKKKQKTDNEISRKQSYVARKELDEIFQKGMKSGKKREDLIYQAFREYDYFQKEIADYLGVHYATISRAIKKVEERRKMLQCKT